VIADPPFEPGALQDSVTLPTLGVAESSTGAPGGAAGTTAFDGAESGPSPTLFVAVTVNV
jgi:hypothetical protein